MKTVERIIPVEEKDILYDESGAPYIIGTQDEQIYLKADEDGKPISPFVNEEGEPITILEKSLVPEEVEEAAANTAGSSTSKGQVTSTPKKGDNQSPPQVMDTDMIEVIRTMLRLELWQKAIKGSRLAWTGGMRHCERSFKKHIKICATKFKLL